MSLTTLKELVVLRAIRDHPQHGYALADHLEESIGWTIGLKKSAIYAVLRRFENRGLITRETSRDTNYPERHTFRITSTGTEAIEELLASTSNDPATPNLPLAVLLIYIDDLPASKRNGVLRNLRDWRVDRLKEFGKPDEHGGAAGVALELIESQLQLEIGFIDRLMAEDENGPD